MRPLPYQYATEEDLLYAELDGRHTAMIENEKRALDFLIAYTTNLAPILYENNNITR
jgi:hypothetical protein